MNENLNLSEILKDCPKGTKFYSTVFGDVYFEKIDLTNDYFPIKFTHSNGRLCSVTNKGWLFAEFNGECTVFPDKNQRDWSKWHRPFVDGDIIFTHIGGKNEQTFVSVFKGYSGDLYLNYLIICLDDNKIFYYDERNAAFCDNSQILEQRLATEEEKRQLFDAIKAKGYRWDSEKKTLEKITDVKESKFDPKTLEPFDKVFMTDSLAIPWSIGFFSHILERDEHLFDEHLFAVGSSHWRYCIPYNDDTKHLIGKIDGAPAFYRYWEK